MTYVPESLLGQRLTPSELTILGAIANGESDRQIAKALFISETTEKTYVRRLFSKLGAVNRAHAVKRGYQLGYLRLDVDTLARKPLVCAA